MKRKKHNVIFDVAASIETEKTFGELSVFELVKATSERLHEILKENLVDSFSFCDEYELDDYENPETAILMEAAWFALRHHYKDFAEYIDLSDDVLLPIKEQLDQKLND